MRCLCSCSTFRMCLNGLKILSLFTGFHHFQVRQSYLLAMWETANQLAEAEFEVPVALKIFIAHSLGLAGRTALSSTSSCLD